MIGVINVDRTDRGGKPISVCRFDALITGDVNVAQRSG